MNAIYLIICVVILQVQAEKLKICIPKKHKLKDVEQAELLFRNSISKETNDEINIPGNISTKLDIKDLISANLSVSDLTISGFHNYSIKLLTITLNSLKIQGKNYQIQGSIPDMFDIYGDGKFEINLEQISFEITNLAISWPLGCFKMNLLMKLQKMEANFENIMGGDSLLQPALNLIIGDLGPDVIDHYWPDIYKKMVPIIQKFLDKYINNAKVEDLSTIQLGNKIVLQKEFITTYLKILSDLLYTQ